MTDQPPLLELVDVEKRFAPTGDGRSVDVLRGVCLKVVRGQAIAIQGRSGSGKSTLLNIIAALDRPTGGRVMLDGRDLAGMDDKTVADLRGRRIGMVFQLHHLLPQCTVLENVLIPTMVRPDADGAEPAMTRALRLLKRVDLSDYLDRRPGQLSGGECQRVAVVRALINQPDLLLADEPTGALDRASADNLTQLLIELNVEEAPPPGAGQGAGFAMLVATHAPELAERMGRMLQLTNGVLQEVGKAK